MASIFFNSTAQGWRAEYNTAGESVLMCDGNQIQSL